MASVDEVIDGFYEGATRSDRLADAVQAAHRLFRSQAGGLYVQNLHQQTGRMVGAEAAIAHGFGEADRQAYWSYFYPLNPMFNLAKAVGAGRVLTDADTVRLGPAKTYRKTEFYNDWARRQGLDHVMGEFLERRGDGVLIMAVWRPASEGAYDAREARALARLNRHIVRAIDVGARLQAAEAEMETVLRRMPSAIFTLGRDGRLRQTNALADALLQSGVALRVADGRLRSAVPDGQAALDRLIGCALDPRLSPWAENAAIALRRSDGEAALTARAVVVARRFDPFGPDRPASVILTVDGFEADGERVGDRLRRRFGLSAAQLRVALLVREGKRPVEIAATLDLSVETVRSHIKTLFARTGARRQVELAIRLNDEAR